MDAASVEFLRAALAEGGMNVSAGAREPHTALADLLVLSNDPVDLLILSGRANSVAEAEELYLQQSWNLAMELLASDISDEQLERHPLMVLLRKHGMRGREDSI
jgi:hypothetical protein